MNNDDDLRQLFQDATADIRPHGTLDDIRTQTKKVDPMARRWFLPSLAAAAVMALVIGGAFWMTRDTDSGKGSSNVATSPTDTPTGSVAMDFDASIYYAGDSTAGHSLFMEKHVIPGAQDAGLESVRAAISGTPGDPDYSSLWPAGTTIDEVADAGEYNEVRFVGAAPSASGMSERDRKLAIEAVVRTAQFTFGNGAPVAFFVGNQRLTSVLGIAGATFAPGDDDTVMAPMQITSLANNATVEAGKLTVDGFAAAFEANVSWEIMLGGDAAIDQGFTTARECCTLAPYSFTTNIALEPGRYTVVVHDNDESGQGRPVNQDTKEIVVE